MSKPDFQERLRRLEEKQHKSAPQVERPPASDKRERLQRALEATDAAGISRAESFPPFHKFLFKLGFTPKPFFYMSSLWLMVIGGGVVFLIFGGVLYSEIGATIKRGPVAGLYRVGWQGVYLITVITAIGFSVYHKVRAKKAGLPRWRDL
ncbi:DUF6404 family protein [Ruegeria atlantica]|uniref:DUF6404 family protein n=1 Tax=Ruegeria atlantica TaxID=81569 RepID=UPI0024950E9A|nr:DUF6404 family protein [Ruegeria atlantica]